MTTTSTKMSPSELRTVARKAVKAEAKAAGVKAKFIDWALRITNHDGRDTVSVIGYGRRDDGYEFPVPVQI